MDQPELFTRAMLTYDAEGLHSAGIAAVVALVRTETRKQVEADAERYPLAERVKDQAELRKLSDREAEVWRQRYLQASADLQRTGVALAALRTKVAELDAKRSDPTP
jgi:hypothetical protein